MTDVRVRRAAWFIVAGLAFFAMASTSPECSRTTDPSLDNSDDLANFDKSAAIEECQNDCKTFADFDRQEEFVRNGVAREACDRDPDCLEEASQVHQDNMAAIAASQAACEEDCEAIPDCEQLCYDEYNDFLYYENHLHLEIIAACDGDRDCRREEYARHREALNEAREDRQACFAACEDVTRCLWDCIDASRAARYAEQMRFSVARRACNGDIDCIVEETAIHQMKLREIARAERECKQPCHEQGHGGGGQ